MTAATKPSLEMLRLAAADPLIDVVDELDVAIGLLATTWVALQSADLLEVYGSDHCHRTMGQGIDRLLKVRKKASEQAIHLREQC